MIISGKLVIGKLGPICSHLNLAMLGVGIFPILTYLYKIAHNSPNHGPIYQIKKVPEIREGVLQVS